MDDDANPGDANPGDANRGDANPGDADPDDTRPGDAETATLGVIDRIVDGVAVVLVGDAEVEVHVPADQLPAEAAEGTWLAVRIAEGSVVGIVADTDATEAADRRVTRRLDRIRDRQGGSRFRE